MNRTNILDYSLYCYSRIWSVNRTSPKYVLCSRLKKSFESGEQFLPFWLALFNHLKIANFEKLWFITLDDTLIECCVDLWCYNSIITLITGIFVLSQLLAQWFECFKIIFWEFVDLYIVMNYLKVERIRREREKKKKWWQTKKICKSRMRSLWPELPVEVEFTEGGFMWYKKTRSSVQADVVNRIFCYYLLFGIYNLWYIFN